MAATSNAALDAFLTAQQGVPSTVVAVEPVETGPGRARTRWRTATGAVLLSHAERPGPLCTPVASEAAVLAALAEAGVAVPRVQAVEPTASLTGVPFLLTDCGEQAAAPAAGPAALAAAAGLVASLRRAHALDWRRAGLAPRAARGGAAAVRAEVERWMEGYRHHAVVPEPLLEEAAAWLHRSAPEPAGEGFLHGAAGPEVAWVLPGGAVRVGRWDQAHLGDPWEDWAACATSTAWLLGRGAWEDVIIRWAGADVSADPHRWHYWLAFALFRRTCAAMAGGPQAREAHLLPLRRLVSLLDA
jgi:aminoglycoside phosphotransferase (APT) family kinase protein